MSETAAPYRVPERPVESLFCTCHGTVKMAEVVNGRLVVMDRRHGQHHLLVLDKIPDCGLPLPL